jgi:hypothetical protein
MAFHSDAPDYIATLDILWLGWTGSCLQSCLQGSLTRAEFSEEPCGRSLAAELPLWALAMPSWAGWVPPFLPPLQLWAWFYRTVLHLRTSAFRGQGHADEGHTHHEPPERRVRSPKKQVSCQHSTVLLRAHVEATVGEGDSWGQEHRDLLGVVSQNAAPVFSYWNDVWKSK